MQLTPLGWSATHRVLERSVPHDGQVPSWWSKPCKNCGVTPRRMAAGQRIALYVRCPSMPRRCIWYRFAARERHSGIAAGLHLGGKTPVVLIQNTGLFESGDVLRGNVLNLQMPLLLMVGVSGLPRNGQRARAGGFRRDVHRADSRRLGPSSTTCSTPTTTCRRSPVRLQGKP